MSLYGLGGKLAKLFPKGTRAAEQPAAPVPHPFETVPLITQERIAHLTEQVELQTKHLAAIMHLIPPSRELVDAHAQIQANMENFMATTAPLVPAPQGKTSFLSHVGGFLRRLLHIGEEAALIAQPIITAAFPDVAPLFNSAIGLALGAEATAATATGSGPQKLAQVVVGLNPLIDKFVADNKLGEFHQANREKFAAAIADALNLIPAPKAS